MVDPLTLIMMKWLDTYFEPHPAMDNSVDHR